MKSQNGVGGANAIVRRERRVGIWTNSTIRLNISCLKGRKGKDHCIAAFVCLFVCMFATVVVVGIAAVEGVAPFCVSPMPMKTLKKEEDKIKDGDTHDNSIR